MVKQLTYEISRYTKADLVTFDNDAKSCYDRIVMSYALLRCKQLGLPDSVTQAVGYFLDNACYHLKTQLGISTNSYQSGGDGYFLHGPGQGSLEGPPLWVMVCSGPMQALEKRFHGLTYSDPHYAVRAHSVVQGFVDDLGKAVNQFNHGYLPTDATEFLSQLIKESTKMAQWWEQLLWATGGKLEIDKCFDYTMHWGFHENGSAFLHSGQS